jgi:RNA polymerase sigma-70 factor (sigma-E family)
VEANVLDSGGRDERATGLGNSISPAIETGEGSASRPARTPSRRSAAERAVGALYEGHAVSFIRLAVVILGDVAAAEDVVQDAFCGLYRRWHHLDDPGKAVQYVRSAVLNGCRSQLRARARSGRRAAASHAGHMPSAEEDAIIAADHQAVLAALRKLPARQREALVLRYYLDLAEPEIANAMAISPGTVKSTTSRALGALGRLLGEDR